MNRHFFRYLFWYAVMLVAVGCTQTPSQARQKSAGPPPIVAAQETPDSLPVVKDPKPTSSIPHDVKSFTQGLLYHNGSLYEGTGERGESVVRKLNPSTGEVEQNVPVDDRYFGEGLAFLEGKFYELTWTAGVCLVYDENLKFQKQLLYGTEGWGLTVEPTEKLLVFSDGSSQIRFLDPSNFLTKRRIDVVDGNGQEVTRLNELEWVKGEIWANVWMSDSICRIDPRTGKIVGWVKLPALVAETQTGNDDVLNGIAYDPETDTLWLTGKLWPKIYKFENVTEQFFGKASKEPSPALTPHDKPRSGSPTPAH